jgi:hypothetical protein
MNHYQVLEVAENASPEVVKAAYKSLMQRFHPDKNPGDATASARAARLAKAYEVLSDPVRRAAYDAEVRMHRAERPSPVKPRPAGAAGDDQRAMRHPAFWTLAATLALIALFGWLLWPIADPKKSPARLTPPVPPPLAGVAVGTSVVPRMTMPDFIRNLRVEIDPAPQSGSPVSPGPRFLLVIPTIDIVVGNFDPDRYMVFMDRNREYIAQRLADHLAKTSPALISGPDAEIRLKRQILDGLAEITGMPAPGARPSAPSPASAAYGAVDALLPDGFTIESRPTGAPSALR